MQVPRNEPEPPAPRARSTIDKGPSPADSPPIAPEDLTELGVESRHILSVVPATPRDEQSPRLAEAENPEGTLYDDSTTHNVPPKSYFLPGVTLEKPRIPHALGEFADVWRGQLDGNRVCVKNFRPHTALNLDKLKRVRGGSLDCDERDETDL